MINTKASMTIPPFLLLAVFNFLKAQNVRFLD